jgi:hypothetical protein
MERLPPTVLAYLRLVGPAVLATLAAVGVMVVLDEGRRASFHVGIEWVAVAGVSASSPGAGTCWPGSWRPP